LLNNENTMEIVISNSKIELGKKAAVSGAELIHDAIRENGKANIIVATGASQFEILEELIKQDVDWSKVTAFHLDEYIGISENHPASFRKYLKERFVDKLDLCAFHYVSGDKNPEGECLRLGLLIKEHPIDVAFIGIGENGHLAFNDPPADFEIEDAYLVVNLDKKCRLQQMGEGWFETLQEVPEQAISMSVKQIMKSRSIICSVPDARKAEAVKGALKGVISPLVPASILQKHESTWLFLDKDSASLYSSEN
jgi:glucosamine-6-phosphate deaminase